MRRKRNFWAKCIAFLLIVVMVLSEQNITTLGETIGSYAQERMAGSSEQQEEGSAKGDEEGQSVPKSMSETDGQQEPSQPQEEATEASTSAPAQDSGAALQQDTSASEQKNAVSSNSAQSSGQDVDANQGQNAQKQDEEQKEEEKVVSKDNKETKTKQKKAAAKQQTDEAKNGEDDTEKETKTDETYLEAAERYYGDNGTMETATVSIKQSNDKNTVLAGNTIPFKIDYKLTAAAYYNYGEKPEPLFDTYDNTRIILHLPVGLSIDTDTSDGLKNVVDRIEEPVNPEEQNDWTLYLSEQIDASSDKPGNFKINLKVDNNGSIEANHIFDFMTNTEGEEVSPVEIQTSFTIIDRTGAGGNQPTYDVLKETESELEPVITTTEDSWNITKRDVSAVPSLDKETVTVSFALTIGLDNGNGGVVSNPETYDRSGRVPFAREDGTITLTEIPSVKDREGQPIQANSITVIPDFDKRNRINVQANMPVSIPVNTCANAQNTDGSALSNVAGTAPYYSTYTVEIVYPYEKFIAHYADEKQGLLTVDNIAKIEYQLAGLGKAEASATASKDAGEITAPAKLIIGKNILPYNAAADDDGEPYTWGNFGEDELVRGPISFQIVNDDTDKVPTLYTYDTDEKRFNKITSDGEIISYNPETGIITYDPMEDKDNKTGRIEIFLDEGDYTVSEFVDDTHPQIVNTKKLTKQDNATYNADDKRVIATTSDTNPDPIIFYNQETLGEIKIEKTGQGINSSNGALSGAVFGLYTNENCDEATKVGDVTTNEQGQATFARLEYRTYWVKEISAPEGYIIDSKVYPVTISEEKSSYTVKSVNKYNRAPVQLQKQIADVNATEEEDAYINVGPAYQAEFAQSFEILEKTEPDKWENVQGTTTLSLGATGTTDTLSLPVYRVAEDGTKTTINYKFKETLPEGWYAIDANDEEIEDGKTVVYSEEFTLIDKLGASISDPKVITMKNDRNGSIELTKNFYEASNGKMVKITEDKDSEGTELTATFKVYYRDGATTGSLTEYKVGNNPVEYKLTPGQTVTIKDLPRTGANGAQRYYYLVETAVSDASYASSDKALQGNNGAEKQTETIGEQSCDVYGPFNFTEPMKEGSNEVVLKQSVTIDNVKQEYPVIIKKVNSYNTDEFVPGASYGIYEKSDTTNNGTGATQPVQSGDILDKNGAFTTLKPGKVYEVEETVTPAGYNNVSTKDELTIDLTNTKVDVDTTAEVITIKNEPDPTLTITKKITGADGKETNVQNPVSFEVYKKDENDTFTQVKDYDNVTNLQITSGTPQQLPEGDYYLKEIVPQDNPNQILDPSKYFDFYDDVTNGEVHNGEFYFGPFNVSKDEEGEKQANHTYDIVNYANTGAVTVTKYRIGVPKNPSENGSKIALPGAEIGIYTKNAEGELVEVEKVNSQPSDSKSDSNGQVTFSGLPIYTVNASGQPEKIKYYIKEIEAPANFTKSETELEVVLEAGTTVTEDTKRDALELINQPTTSLTVEKSYYNKWEYNFTNKKYLLQGAEIALYKKTDDDTYTFVETGKTDEQGRVTFRGLTQKDEYVAIEVDVPDGEKYQYLKPEDGTDYLRLARDENGKLPETISTDSETGIKLSDYYYVTKDANTEEMKPQGEQERFMTNVENWAQLQIWKYDLDEKIPTPNVPLDDPSDTQYTPDNPLHNNACEPVNNAQFTLYMEVLLENTANNAELSYDPTKEYTEIGSYSSGTLYDTDGKRKDGWFGTDILKSADNVVYWLVETKAGIGANIRPENVVTLIRRAGTSYSNSTLYTYTEGENEIETTATNVMEYQDNAVTKETLRNDDTTGPGSAMFSTVRIAKWAGKRNGGGEKVNDFTPLGNATFELYLADEDGNLYNKLDTLTTGLDNDISDLFSQAELSAWASSKAFSWEDIQAYRDEVPESVFIDGSPAGSDDKCDHYVRVAIKEISAPTGYQMDVTNTYYMYMFFDDGGENTTTEIFNDAYYVKGDGKTEDQTVSLADEANKEGIKWAFYPTTENEDGTYLYMNQPLPDSISGDSYQYRLVNWPVDTQAVTVRTYGYEVQNDNKNMTSEELNTYYNAGTHQDRENISVSMKLEYLDITSKTWKSYADASLDNSDGTFTTGSNGYYVFPKGLRMGQYRLTEKAVPNLYENIYDGEGFSDGANSGQIRAYYFKVEADNLDLQLYNPKKLSMSIKKTASDNSNTTLEGVQFTLTNKDANANISGGKTNADGIAEFNNIGTGHYVLEESTPATGYSNSYFKNYIKTEYGGIASIADKNGTGLFLGYTTSQEAGENGTSVIVTEKKDFSFYGISAQGDIDLNITNPKKVSFNITKQDADDNGTMLPDAEFTVEYMSFGKVKGSVEVNYDTGTWTKKGTVTTKNGENGTTLGVATFLDGDPGIYRITETKEPSGYDLTDTTPKYIAMTGGLPIGEVKVDGITIDKDTDASLVFKDDKQVSLNITKTINRGKMSIAEENTFTFSLYNSNKIFIKRINIKTNGNNEGDGSFTGLSQEETYYLKETNIPTGFEFESLKLNGTTSITPDPDGYYKIEIPDNGTNVSVTATNTYLYAQTTIMKVDGANGKPLTGAEFEVYRVKDGQEEKLGSDKATVKPASKEGYYTVKVLLEGKGTECFRIKETKEPFNYLKDTNSCIEFTIENGEVQSEPEWSSSYSNQEMLSKRIFPNYNGAYIDIVKYDDRHDVSSAAPYTGKDAVFTLYKYVQETGWTEAATSLTTDAEGKIHVVVEGGVKYALRETTVPNGYQGLDSIWRNAKGQPSEKIEPTQEDGTVYYVINKGQPLEAGQTYSYNAYNTPYLPLEIQKHNSTDPSKQLTAMTAVYEIPEGSTLDDNSTNEEVQKFIQDNPPLTGLNNISVNTKGQENEKAYSYADGRTTNGTLNNAIVSGKTYLVVETSASDSLIRDNSEVQWFDVIKPDAAKGTKQVAYLYNVVGDITLNMTKSAANPVNNSTPVKYESLYLSEAEVEYTLTPTVENTYPLDKFVVTDDGLTAYNNDNGTATELPGYMDNAYSLTEVEVGPATHDITSYAGTEANDTITATVTFKDGNGIQIGNPVRLNNVSDNADTATLQQAKESLPADEREVKAAKVEITYSCEGMNGTSYALGTDFNPGSIKIKAKIDKQAGGADKKDIDSIKNNACSTLGYSEWSTAGEKTVASDRTAEAAATIYFDDLKGAKVSVTKSIEDNKQSVALLDTLVYNITVSNDATAEAAMESPYIVDYLPQGTTWVNYQENSDDTTEVSQIINLIKEDGVNISCDLNGISSQTKDGETAVFIHLNGELKPGEEVTIQLRLRVENTVTFFGQSIDNYVLVGSDVDGIASESNPQGASFMNANNQWAEKIDDVLGTMQLSQSRLDTLKDILGTNTEDGFVAAKASVNWRSSSVLTLDKAAYGDRNATDGYTTGNLSTVNNGGTMHYRLSVSNTSADNVVTNFSVIDILPNKQDTTPAGAVRDSFWRLNFGEISEVYIQKGDGTQETVASENYTLYCYTGQLNTTEDYRNLYNQTESFKKEMKPEELGTLSGWSEYNDTTNKNDITAFIVAADTNVEIEQNETLVIKYTATVNGNQPWDEATLNLNSYQNAVNSFACTYGQYDKDDAEKEITLYDIIGSNQVSATILPGQVKVGGHVWIDKDNDGIQDDGESMDNFAGNVLIERLLNQLQITLSTYSGTNPTATKTEDYSFNSGTNMTADNPAYFEFDELDPAARKENISDELLYKDGVLQPSQLKGSAPATYILNTTLPAATVAGQYEIAKTIISIRKSWNPADKNTFPAGEKTDNNFAGTTGSKNAASERFYLWATNPNIIDKTKDLGIVPYRDLTITKEAEDNQEKIEGATFTVYGPFADDTDIEDITVVSLNNANKKTISTNKNGIATFEKLLRFQKYVIVEDSPATGYDLSSAAATKGDDYTSLSDKFYVDTTNASQEDKEAFANKPMWMLNVLDEKSTDDQDEVTVTNKRTAVDTTLTASKTYVKNNEERTPLSGTFIIDLWENYPGSVDSTTEQPAKPISEKTVTVTNGNGTVSFSKEDTEKLSFTSAKDSYEFYITEQSGNTAGVTYDTTIYKAKVKVDWVEGEGLEVSSVNYFKQNGEGNWDPIETNATPTFTNTYSASGPWTPVGTKTLTGRDMKDGETFTFSVKEGNNEVSTGTVTGGANGQKTDITFGEIRYDLDDVGKHTYTITEDVPNGAQDNKLNGVTYDSTTYTVEVTVSDNGDGTLEVTPTYKNGNATVSSADFTNSYVPTKTEYKPTVEKTLTGQSIPDGTTKEFTFVLSALSDNAKAVLPQDEEITISFNNDGTKKTGTFAAITFTQGGTYTFKITENSGGQNDGYTYDDAEWTLTVVVTDDQVGALSIDNKPTYKCNNSEVSENNSGAEFTNDYTPASVDGQLAVSKVVKGAPMAEEETFTFTQSSAVTPIPDGIDMPDNNEVQITVNPDDTTAKTAQFAAITFTKAGTYYFQIKEDTASLPNGYDKYIDAAKLAKVVVKDVGGQLEIEDIKYYTTDASTEGTTSADTGDKAAFTNRYNTVDTVFAPKVTKVFTGDAPTGEKIFTFQMTRGDDKEGVTMPSNNTASVIYNGNTGTIKDISFDEITFTKAGTYTFKITEQQGEQKDGYTYDVSEWTLTVKVEDNNSQLEVTESKYRRTDGKESTNCAEFTNTYTLTPVDYAPQVQKTIEGAAVPENSTASFAFTLTNIGRTDGVNLAEGVTKDVTISAADIKANQGTKQFDPLTFTKAGTYEFQIAETRGTENGYTYDQKNWKLTITVEDKGGYLEVTNKQYTIMYTAEGEDDGANADKASFTNTYAVTPVPYTPQVEKTFSADSVARPTAKDFEFVLTADAGNPQNGAFTGGAAGTALAGKHNTLKTTVSGTGTAFFDEITFTKAGTYHFTIEETEGTDLGYTYDDAKWTLTVTVTDVGGQLTATQTYKSSDDAVQEKDDKAVFENTYSYVASILLNKEVLRGDAAYETNDVFYAGIFTKTTSADGGETTYDRVGDVVTLNNNDSVEVFVPLGGADQTEAITYYVFETDQEGHPLISFGEDGEVIYNQPSVYEISISSKDKDGNDSHIGEVYVTPDGATMHPEVTITNRVSNVSIEKTDMDGAPLSGATLELWKTADSVDADETADAERTKDDEGNVLLETWVSDGTPHELVAELAIGGTYYLHEKEAPEGYVMAADIPFTVENGEPITLVMEDMAQTQAMGQIAVTKRLSTIDESTFDFVALVAADETFYVGLFTDPEGKHPYGEDYVKPIRIQGASSNTVTFDNLPSGTYYVFETLQDGTIIPYGEVQDDNGNGVGSFACISDSSNGTAKEITLDFAVENIEGTTELNNVYYGDLPDGFSYQGEISITKSIIKNGAPADSSDTFYAGIFTSETENTPYKVVTLKNNGTVTVEVPLGGETGMDPITYYIYETDANGNKLDKNSFAYSVSGEGTVALDLNNTTGSRTIINTMASSSENTTTINPTDDTKKKKTSDKTGKDKNSSTGTSRRTTSSKTGDDNRIALYVLFFGAAVVGIVISLWKRKKYTE